MNKNMFIGCGFFLFFLVVTGLLLPLDSKGQDIDSCTNSSCHLSEQDQNIHSLSEGNECTGCHLVKEGQHHPTRHAASDFSGMSGDGCWNCHELSENDHYHPPYIAGDCSTCHNPHLGENVNLLVSQEEEICFDCHADMRNPNAKSRHETGESNSCLGCHRSHASNETFLLKKKYNSALYMDYNREEYALCFSCHQESLLKFADTRYYTQFRDANRNLHYLHVNKIKKGRGCQTCHEIHSSSNVLLIANEIQYGNWRMPINFVKTENGGSCSPGCHQTYTYDRRELYERKEDIEKK